MTRDSKSQCRPNESVAAGTGIWSGFSRALRLSVANQPYRLQAVVVSMLLPSMSAPAQDLVWIFNFCVRAAVACAIAVTGLIAAESKAGWRTERGENRELFSIPRPWTHDFDDQTGPYRWGLVSATCEQGKRQSDRKSVV